MTTEPQNTLPKVSTFDKQLKLGPLDYTYEVWIMILIVVVAVYIYFTRYYKSATPSTDTKGYYYY